jgi:hypothetical protein
MLGWGPGGLSAYPPTHFSSDELVANHAAFGGANDAGQGKAYFVNGVGYYPTDVAAQASVLAQQTGKNIVPIYSTTDGPDGLAFPKDLAGFAAGQLPQGAPHVLANELYQDLANGASPTVYAHSRGAAETTAALKNLSTTANLTPITVNVMGGAASDYPTGPHYNFYQNENDLVPAVFGTGPVTWQSKLLVDSVLAAPQAAGLPHPDPQGLPPNSTMHRFAAGDTGLPNPLAVFNNLGTSDGVHGILTYIQHLSDPANG